MNAQDCATDPIAALLFNGIATTRLVEAACQANVQRFIYLSTAHVYASPLVGNITEKTCPSNLHPYATSHLVGENAVLCADQRGLIEAVVLRLSNCFGPPTHKFADCWSLLVNDLCKQVVQKDKMVLHTSGLQQRDFIAITEVCQFIERFVVHDKGRIYQKGIFNVGAGTSQSVLAMAKIIQQRCQKVLSFMPELECKQGLNNQTSVTLSYQTSRPSEYAINPGSATFIEEIDKLLRYCQKEFSYKKFKHE
jgi:UDP-glucose 4-epimerase